MAPQTYRRVTPRSFALLALALLLAPPPAAAQAPGASITLTNNGVQAAAQYAAPLLQAALLQLALPDQKFNEVVVDIHLTGIRVARVAVGATASAAADGALAVALTLSDFHLVAQYEAWVVGIPAGSGPCDVEVDAAASVTVAVSADCSAGPTACKPRLAAQDARVSVSTISPVCKGVAGQVLDALVDLFKGAVQQSLTDAAQAAIASLIDAAANAALQRASLDVPLQGGSVLARFDLTAAAPPSGASGGYLALPLLGDAVVAANASARAPFPLPVLPPGPFGACSAAALQLALSEFSLEALGWALWRVGALASLVPHTVLPPAFPIQLNTTDVALLAPGLARAYPGQWMQLALALTAPPAANVSAQGGLALAAPLAIAFQALPPAGGAPATAFTLACPLALALTLGVAGSGSAQNLTANVTAAGCQLAVASSSVGPVDARGLALLVDFVLQGVLLPLANALLNAGLPLPSVQGLALTGASVFYAAGFAGVCTNFTAA